MNKKQKEIFKKLVGLSTEYDLVDIKVALAAFQDDGFLSEIAEALPAQNERLDAHRP